MNLLVPQLCSVLGLEDDKGNSHHQGATVLVGSSLHRQSRILFLVLAKDTYERKEEQTEKNHKKK